MNLNLLIGNGHIMAFRQPRDWRTLSNPRKGNIGGGFNNIFPDDIFPDDIFPNDKPDRPRNEDYGSAMFTLFLFIAVVAIISFTWAYYL